MAWLTHSKNVNLNFPTTIPSNVNKFHHLTFIEPTSNNKIFNSSFHSTYGPVKPVNSTLNNPYASNALPQNSGYQMAV